MRLAPLPEQFCLQKIPAPARIFVRICLKGATLFWNSRLPRPLCYNPAVSFYSKYRPQNFANLVGQDHLRQTLLHEIQQGTLSHAYLFTGPRGTGKTSTARLIAKAINCEKRNEEGEPCDECELCSSIKEGSLIDVLEIDAASNRSIDEIRDLKEKIVFAPTRAKSKTYIIDEVHMLTKEAFNALLKTLEEPPENVYFILCTTEAHKIPETIISRCQRFDFKRIDVRTLMTRLSFIAQKEGIEAEDAAIELIARHVEGGLRDAIGLFEQMTIDGKLRADHVRNHLGITGHQTVEDLLRLLEQRDAEKALHVINEVHREGYDLASFVREVLECLRERLIAAVLQGGAESLLWLGMIERFEEARNMLRNTVIPELPLEIAVIKITGSNGAKGEHAAQKDTQKEESRPAKSAADKSEKLATSSTPDAQKAEEKTAAVLKHEYNMEQYSGDLSAHWPRVLEHVQPPSLRRSLSDAKMSEAQDGGVTLAFRSKFHMEKASNAEARAKIEKAVLHLFGKTVKVICVLEPEAPSAASAAAATEPRVAALKEQPKKSQSFEELARKAMEIFESNE
ncbi:DNA polymerase III subunit gamma/tau [Candidatus Peregrinibacteria bacterium]|nr:DNA polymerase III subunit gamma/tau [Candidatus Peregrinibacteria bacterium]